MTATIVITTKNRKEDLCRALESCVRQSGSPEILVVDDGSTDGTADMVRERFSMVHLIRNEDCKGYVLRRNEGAAYASGDVIVSIDDDATFADATVVETVLKEIEPTHIAAVAVPFINMRQERTLQQQAPDGEDIWIANEFIGTAHAVKKSLFLSVGGYRPVLTHQGEEGDLSLRLLERGHFVRLGRSAPILHYESPRRSFARINYFGQRNLILFAWYNVPMPEFLLHLGVTIVNGLVWGVRRGYLWHRIRGTFAGLASIISEFRQRAPIRRTTYWLYRDLKKCGPRRLRDICPEKPR